MATLCLALSLTQEYERVCNFCHIVKSFDEFYMNQGKPRSYCKDCGKQRRDKENSRRLGRLYHAQYPNRAAEYTRRYRQRHPERKTHERELSKRWWAANPEKARYYNWRHTAKRRESMRRDRVTIQQIRDRIAVFGGLCWICGKPYEELDHVKPLAKGGRHIPANLRPACKLCNRQKNATWPFRKEMLWLA